ncbi:MAG: 30S ribosomal protein S21 [Candidatus Brocadiia bacterium]
MIKVDARDNESLDKLLRRFKKLCEKEGLSRDIKKASVYEKPSERRSKKARSRKH